MHVHVVQFILWFIVLVTLTLHIKLLCVTIQIKTIEQYFQLALFIVLYKVVLTFKSVDESLIIIIATERYIHVVPFYTVKGGCKFLQILDGPTHETIKVKVIEKQLEVLQSVLLCCAGYLLFCFFIIYYELKFFSFHF